MEIRTPQPERARRGLILPGEPEYNHKPAGHIYMDDGETAVTLQCIHCGKHWIPIKGSKRKRGFCTNCMGPLCGAKECLTQCDHFMKKLERHEAGK